MDICYDHNKDERSDSQDEREMLNAIAVKYGEQKKNQYISLNLNYDSF